MSVFNVDFEPVGRRVQVQSDETLLEAAQTAGVSLTAICGGIGVCGACKVRLIEGVLSKPKSIERETFSEEELALGWRLACQAYPRSDLKLEIPPESLTTTQRLQMEGAPVKVALEPAVWAIDLQVPPPNLTDLRADWERFQSALAEQFMDFEGEELSIELPALSNILRRLRDLNWGVRVVLGNDRQIIGLLAEGSPYYGVAVDIGTTKMAGFLVNLISGKTVARLGMMNPQIAYGEDVIARIAFANQKEGNQQTLHSLLIDSINQLVEDLCEVEGIKPEQVVDYVVVGNTAMHHFFWGLPVKQLGQAPYVPAVRSALHFPGFDLNLRGAPGARVYTPPNIAGYVGADHIAMLLASEMESKSGITIALDIGTNTEISLAKGKKLVSCSCASGPAFEGAHIHAGMRAIPGAVERAEFFDGVWHLATIDNEQPVGICGSGILDVVAALLESGQIDSAGRFTDTAFRRVSHLKASAIVLVPRDQSGTGQDILVTRQDIREIQLAKAAIRAGIDALLRDTQTDETEITSFLVAGAFGTYLSLDSAIRIGMFPPLPRGRFKQIGNAAGAGAQQMLVSQPSRHQVETILEKMSYIELTTDPGFMDSYIDSIVFPLDHKEE